MIQFILGILFLASVIAVVILAFSWMDAVNDEIGSLKTRLDALEDKE